MSYDNPSHEDKLIQAFNHLKISVSMILEGRFALYHNDFMLQFLRDSLDESELISKIGLCEYFNRQYDNIKDG